MSWKDILKNNDEIKEWVIKDENYSHWDFTGTESEAKEFIKDKKLVGWGLLTEVKKGKWLVITEDERGYEYDKDIDYDKDLARREEPKGGPAGFRQRDDIMFDYEMD